MHEKNSITCILNLNKIVRFNEKIQKLRKIIF